MGLDITAYKGLKAVSSDTDGDDVFAPSNALLRWTEKHWPGRTAGIEPGTAYRAADVMSFAAGSYGGYGAWRRRLAELAGHGSAEAVWEQETPAGPFVELINFADNEGVIGPIVAAKLARDFAEWQAKAEAFAAPRGADGAYFLAKYQGWREVFEMAADRGAVEFH